MSKYTIEKHGKGYAIYLGRDWQHHGANIGHLTEVTPATIKLIEDALNATLAQPEQEPTPVGMTCKVWTHGCALFDGIDLPNETLLYTAPISKAQPEPIKPSDLLIDTYSVNLGAWSVNNRGVKITHVPTGTVVCSDSERSQHANKRVAMQKLEAALAQPEQEKESTPSNVDPRVLLISDTDFTKETGNRLCDIERRLAAIETQSDEANKKPHAVSYKDGVPVAYYNFDPPPYTAPPSKQEPVAWLDSDGFPWTKDGMKMRITPDDYRPLYTAPPKREWVSLTDDEAYQLLVDYCDDDLGLLNAIEDALRSKNNG